MRKFKISTLLTLFIGVLCLGQVTFAASEKAKDEGWDVPNIVLGNGLTDDEKTKTQEILLKDLSKVSDLDGVDATKYNSYIIDGNDLVKYVTDVPEFTSDSKAYSSALIARTKSGSGVTVDIVTPENITARTEAMYRSAAITSGIYDAYIRIASVKTMDGSGALAGIYKIYDEVDPAEDTSDSESRAEKRAVAQEQMQVVESIDQNNQDNSDYSSENILVMLANIQLELQKINDKLSDLSDDERTKEVETVVKEQIDKNGLSDAINSEQQAEIVNNMVAFTKTDGITDTEMTDQLSNFKDDLIKNGKEFKDNLLSDENISKAKSGFGKFWQSIKDFFGNIFS